MSLFCYLDKKSINELKDSEIKFEIGINKLNSDEKDHLLMYMYKARHNLLVNLAEEKNKNICLKNRTLRTHRSSFFLAPIDNRIYHSI